MTNFALSALVRHTGKHKVDTGFSEKPSSLTLLKNLIQYSIERAARGAARTNAAAADAQQPQPSQFAVVAQQCWCRQRTAVAAGSGMLAAVCIPQELVANTCRKQEGHHGQHGSGSSKQPFSAAGTPKTAAAPAADRGRSAARAARHPTLRQAPWPGAASAATSAGAPLARQS